MCGKALGSGLYWNKHLCKAGPSSNKAHCLCFTECIHLLQILIDLFFYDTAQGIMGKTYVFFKYVMPTGASTVFCFFEIHTLSGSKVTLNRVLFNYEFFFGDQVFSLFTRII